MIALTPSLPSRILLTTAIAAVTTLPGLQAEAESVFLDLGSADGQAGIDPKPAAETVLDASASEGTLTYDVSGLDLGGTATSLNLAVVSDNGANLRIAAKAGIAVSGGSNRQWDTGEDLTFTLSLVDSDAVDVTERYSVDLVGAEIRWTANSGVAQFNDAEATARGTARLASDFVSYSFAAGETDEATVRASIDGGIGTQLAGLEFDIALAPEPGSMALFSTGALLLFRRRQKRA